MSQGHGRKVAILSSVHLALDNRVFYREARTLARAGYDVTLIAVHDRDEVRDGVRIRALPRVARRRRPLRHRWPPYPWPPPRRPQPGGGAASSTASRPRRARAGSCSGSAVR